MHQQLSRMSLSHRMQAAINTWLHKGEPEAPHESTMPKGPFHTKNTTSARFRRVAISAASYRGAKCPTLKNSRKNSRKGCRVGYGKTAEKQPEKHPKHTKKTVKTAVFRVFRVFFRLFFGCFAVTHSAPFSAVFRLFSMSGIWHLYSWPQRLQP